MRPIVALIFIGPLGIDEVDIWYADCIRAFG